MSRVTLSELLVRLITATGELGEKAPDWGLVTTGTGLLLMYLETQNIVIKISQSFEKYCS